MISTIFFNGPNFKEGEDEKSCPCWRNDVPRCSKVDKEKIQENFEVDLEDIASSLLQVMLICRLKPWEVRLTKELIKRSFRHYEEVMYRIDRLPNKRFGKENFLRDIAVEAGMNRMDSQMAYGIVKRAFRAYYHGSGEGGRRKASLLAQLRHRSECLWLHAAKRTAEVFAAYAGLMYSEEQQYAECIECVYKPLHDSLQSRLMFDEPEAHVCTCKGTEPTSEPMPAPEPTPKPNKFVEAVNKVIEASSNQTISIGVRTVKTTELFFNRQVVAISKQESAESLQKEFTTISVDQLIAKMEITSLVQISSKTSERSNDSKTKKKRRKRKIVKCNCPHMQCFQERMAPAITAECSQGPFICRWLNYNEEDEEKPHHRVASPIEVCPPCDSRSCDEECTCTCHVCTCPPSYVDYMEEAHGEKVSSTGVESRDTDYCYLVPLRDWPRTPTGEEEEDLMIDDEEEAEVADPCICDCEYKRRGFPHLFTYLAPFKDVKPKTVKVPVEEKTYPVPPTGVSMTCYLCWNERTESSLTESSQRAVSPYITLLSTQKPANMHVDVKVKTQHYPNPTGKPPKGNTRSSVVVKKSTVAALESNIKAAQAAQAAKPPPKPVPPPPAAQPAQPAQPGQQPPQNQPEDDDKLTKDDIMAMFGL